MSDHSPPISLDVANCLLQGLVLYSLAEFQAGHCTTITVDAKDKTFSISDDGRGHAIERTVDGSPYLKFIYTHLDYPFEPPMGAPVQLHGIGMSLINALCSELTLVVRKPTATLRMHFRNGSLRNQGLSEAGSSVTGNTISGVVASHLSQSVDQQALRSWLHAIKATAPSLKLSFNNQEVHVL